MCLRLVLNLRPSHFSLCVAGYRPVIMAGVRLVLRTGMCTAVLKSHLPTAHISPQLSKGV